MAIEVAPQDGKERREPLRFVEHEPRRLGEQEFGILLGAREIARRSRSMCVKSGNARRARVDFPLWRAPRMARAGLRRSRAFTRGVEIRGRSGI
jgi:hypothetical protein